MEKIFTDFGVQPVYLAAQAVNFFILLIILKKFLYKPLLKTLEDRKKTVAESLANAERIKSQLVATETESAEIISAATLQAKSILDNAAERANNIIAEAHEKARADSEAIVAKGQQSIIAEREMMKKAMSDELAGLVILGIEKISEKIVETPEHQKVVQTTVDRLKEDLESY